MSEKYLHVLSKSRFVSGVQCAKKLFLELNQKELKPAISASQQAVFDQGHRIGKMAQDLYPNGIDLTSLTHFDYTDAIDNTLNEMQKKTPVFFDSIVLVCFISNIASHLQFTRYFWRDAFVVGFVI